MIIRFNGELHRVDEYIHRTPGNLRAFVQAKLRNLKSGRTTDTRFRSGEELEEVRMETKEFTYLYHDGASFQFMDKQSYEQMPVSAVAIGEGAKFLKEGETVQLMMVGMDINASMIEPVRAVRPVGSLKRLWRNGAATASPMNPITTEGMPASTSIVGLSSSRTQRGATSARYTAQATPTGTAITNAPALFPASTMALQVHTGECRTTSEPQNIEQGTPNQEGKIPVPTHVV